MNRLFTFVSMPAAGHVTPTLPLVAELVRRGHRVRYGTADPMLDAVAAAGAEPVALPYVFPSGPPAPGPDGAPPSKEMLEARLAVFSKSVEDVFPVLVDELTANPPAVVCGDALGPVGALAAQRAGLPYAGLHPSFAGNEHFSLRERMLATEDPMGQAMAAAFAAVGDRDAEFARSQGLQPFWFGDTGDLDLVFVPREFQIAGDTFGPPWVFTGPDLGSRADDEWTPPAPLHPDGPLVLISLGTAFNARPDFFRMCAEAFRDSPWQVVMSIGNRVDPAELGELPDNVVALPFVPQIPVLRRASVFVTHNGMNSTLEALYLGVPQVGVPQMLEQDLNAERVEELGCGRRLDPRTLDAATLRATVDEVAGDPSYRAAAEKFGARMHEVDAPALGADALEELARSRD
ncbi:macrolide family glycosyltransferase [Pseudonocardia phyllosphaerae]|uniref:macrolide family glycosyltransferase n=1 Tax=Pseudonocardia phyllosphaerae TaxID=3390502 RepID=UPI00397C37B3